MDIPSYKNFEEKSKHLNIVKIDNLIDFEVFCERQQKLKVIYRGVSSSSYKIYTIKQREYFIESKNKNYIEPLNVNNDESAPRTT